VLQGTGLQHLLLQGTCLLLRIQLPVNCTGFQHPQHLHVAQMANGPFVMECAICMHRLLRSCQMLPDGLLDSIDNACKATTRSSI
jgi:predicted ATPase